MPSIAVSSGVGRMYVGKVVLTAGAGVEGVPPGVTPAGGVVPLVGVVLPGTVLPVLALGVLPVGGVILPVLPDPASGEFAGGKTPEGGVLPLLLPSGTGGAGVVAGGGDAGEDEEGPEVGAGELEGVSAVKGLGLGLGDGLALGDALGDALGAVTAAPGDAAGDGLGSCAATKTC